MRIHFFPNNIEIWHPFFDFSNSITLECRAKQRSGGFYRMDQFITFCRAVGVGASGKSIEPIKVDGLVDHETYGVGTYVVTHDEVTLGWIKYY